MELAGAQLGRRLADIEARCFLVHGPETLLVEEARDLIRAHFSAAGFGDATRASVESGFDWDAFSQASCSLSLFSRQRYLELRLSSGRPGDAGAAFIAEFARRADPDTVLVVICGKLDKKQLATKWVRGVAEHGAVVDTGSVNPARLPEWIVQRFRAQGVACSAEAAARLAYYVEGNLLAADQEVRKMALSLAPETRVDEAVLERVMADHARFNVFNFVDACLAGQPARGVRILGSLRREGVEPVLLVWALAREIRSLGLIGAELKAGGNRQEVFRRHRVWASRAPLVIGTLKRVGLSGLAALQRRVALLDRWVKGQDAPQDAPADVWHELERITLGICGIKPGNLTLNGPVT